MVFYRRFFNRCSQLQIVDWIPGFTRRHSQSTVSKPIFISRSLDSIGECAYWMQCAALGGLTANSWFLAQSRICASLWEFSMSANESIPPVFFVPLSSSVSARGERHNLLRLRLVSQGVCTHIRHLDFWEYCIIFSCGIDSMDLCTTFEFLSSTSQSKLHINAPYNQIQQFDHCNNNSSRAYVKIIP